MKFSEILNNFEPDELEKTLADVNETKPGKGVTENILTKLDRRTGLSTSETRRRGISLSKRAWFALAACMVLIVGLGVGTYAYAEEAKEYAAATRFFEENCLSTEGLTRWEIKAVYRDITTESFTYDKTAEVIEHSLITRNVQGWEVIKDDPTPEDIANMWALAKDPDAGWVWFPVKHDDIWFQSYYDTETGGGGIRKYDGETLIWQKEYDYLFLIPIRQGDRLITAARDKGDLLDYDTVVVLDLDGNILFTKSVYEDGRLCSIHEILPEEDGSFAVFGKSGEHAELLTEMDRVFFKRFSASGEELASSELPPDAIDSILTAARFGEGYILVHMDNYLWADDENDLVILDRDGNITKSINVSTEDRNICLVSAAEFGGVIYASGYAVEKTGKPELSALSDYMWTEGADGKPLIETISEEELGALIRENYKAVLFVIDPDDGEPREFYSADGGLGMELEVKDGRLVWEVGNILAGKNLITSAFRFQILGMKDEYTFEPTGALASVEKTDVPFTTTR